MKHRFNVSNLRKTYCTCFLIENEILWDRIGITPTPPVEGGEGGSLVEEVVVRSVEVNEGPLQGLRSDLREPRRLGLFLELGEHPAAVREREPLALGASGGVLVGGVVVDPGAEEVVVDEPARTKLAGHPETLFGVRVEAVAVGAGDLHTLYTI